MGTQYGAGTIENLGALTSLGGSWVSNTTYTGFGWRVGSLLYFNYQAATSGAPTSTNLTLNVPNGLSVDEALLPANMFVAMGGAVNSGTVTAPVYAYYVTSTNVMNIIYFSAATTAANVTQAAPFTFGAGDLLNIAGWLPISGW